MSILFLVGVCGGSHVSWKRQFYKCQSVWQAIINFQIRTETVGRAPQNWLLSYHSMMVMRDLSKEGPTSSAGLERGDQTSAFLLTNIILKKEEKCCSLWKVSEFRKVILEIFPVRAQNDWILGWAESGSLWQQIQHLQQTLPPEKVRNRTVKAFQCLKPSNPSCNIYFQISGSPVDLPPHTYIPKFSAIITVAQEFRNAHFIFFLILKDKRKVFQSPGTMQQ